MRKRIDILRQAPDAGRPEGDPAGVREAWHQVFLFETEDDNATVANVLLALNRRAPLLDEEGQEARPIRWESSCLQKKCGACAMVVEGVPTLACDARLASYKSETIHLEPLRKFPVVEDLLVDRSGMFATLQELAVWLEDSGASDQQRNELVYEASRCLQCGCCLEVCPNFSADNRFAGTAAMVPMTRILAEAAGPQEKAIRKSYARHFYEGCGKSLACRNICPAGIDVERLMVRSNAAAVWRRFLNRRRGNL